MENFETKWNKYTRYGNGNEPATKKYFVETQNAHHENLIVNESGFKVHTEHPRIGASLDWWYYQLFLPWDKKIRDKGYLQLWKWFC